MRLTFGLITWAKINIFPFLAPFFGGLYGLNGYKLSLIDFKICLLINPYVNDGGQNKLEVDIQRIWPKWPQFSPK